MYLWSAVLSYGATAFVFLDTPTMVISLVLMIVAASVLTMNIPRLRRGRGSFTGTRTGAPP
jgi:uncharacterized membrane-anchored protein YitT (DUF2179 family)